MNDFYHEPDYEEPNYVSIWFGNLNEEDLDNYLEEHYTEDGDPIPSKFCKDMGITWYDHDFQDAFVSSNNLDDILSELSYSNSFKDNVKQVVQQNKFIYTTVIALYDFKFSGKMISEKHVKFFGSFFYKKD